MKNLKRIALLCAVIIAFCTVAVTFTSNDTMAASSYNTGTRHQIATSLSAQAQAYYAGEYTFENISTLSPDQIKTKLYTLMSSTMTDSVSYSSLTGYWKTTDASEGKSGTTLFYSDAKSESYNREHVWPKSRASYYKKNGGCDLHHLRPTDTAVNSTRSNYTMGEVRTNISNYSTYSYGGKTVLYYSSSNDLVEVNSSVKGDVARILLYVYVRWQQPNLYENIPTNQLPPLDSDDDENNGKKVIESLETLLKWNGEDPVDTWEMSRNDKIEDIQGNRNVFIDYPEYAWLLFGQDVPNNIQTPTSNGGAVANTPTPTPSSGTTTPTPSPTPTPTTGSTPTPTPISGSVGDYALVTNLNDFSTGDYIIYGVNGNYKGAMDNVCTSSRMGRADVSVTNNVITNPDPSIVWHFESKGNSAFSIYNAAAGKYLTIFKASSGGYSLSDTPDVFTVTVDQRYNNAFCVESGQTAGRFISIYQNDFRAYETSNYKELHLYKRIETAATPTPTSSVTPSPTPIGTIKYGDVNGDNDIDASDASLILRWVVRLDDISEQGMKNADVDLNKEVSAADASCILRFVVRLIDKLGA